MEPFGGFDCLLDERIEFDRDRTRQLTYGEFQGLCIAQMEALYAFALRLARSVPEAEDMVQSTYSRAFSHWRELRDRTAIRAWLFQILRSIFLNERRRLRVSPILELVPSGPKLDVPDPAPLPNAMAERFGLAEVEAALENLPEAQREVALLADLWGFTYPEIARIVGCPVGTVRSRLHRARATLADELEDLARRRGYLSERGRWSQRRRGDRGDP